MPEQITDTSLMPFGKYGPDKGDHRQMQDIPAPYLVWLYDSEFWWVKEKYPEVYDYIADNLEQIEAELQTRKAK